MIFTHINPHIKKNYLPKCVEVFRTCKKDLKDSYYWNSLSYSKPAVDQQQYPVVLLPQVGRGSDWEFGDGQAAPSMGPSMVGAWHGAWLVVVVIVWW